jgi:hypothetical protein
MQRLASAFCLHLSAVRWRMPRSLQLQNVISMEKRFDRGVFIYVRMGIRDHDENAFTKKRFS